MQHAMDPIEQSEKFEEEGFVVATQLASLLGPFKEQSVDQQVRSDQQSLLLWSRTLGEFNFHVIRLIVDIAELFLGNLGHSTDVGSITIGFLLVGGVDPARDQTAAKRATMPFHTEIDAHATHTSRRMNFVYCIVVGVVDLPLRNTERKSEKKLLPRQSSNDFLLTTTRMSL